MDPIEILARYAIGYTEKESFTPEDFSVYYCIAFESQKETLPGDISPAKVDSFLKSLRPVFEKFQLHDAILENQDYQQQLLEQLQFRTTLINPDVPHVRIHPDSLAPDSCQQLFKNATVYGILFTADAAIVQDTVHVMQIDAIQNALDDNIIVLGIHPSWLMNNGHQLFTQKALWMDDKQLICLLSFQQPIQVDMIHFLMLQSATESSTHQALTEQLKPLSVSMINPYSPSLGYSESKYQSFQLWSKAMDVPIVQPESLFLSKNTVLSSVIPAMTSFLSKHTAKSFYLLPDHGTEGLNAACFDVDPSDALSPDHPAIEHLVSQIFPQDDAILRIQRGNLYYENEIRHVKEYLPFVLRVNVSWNGVIYQAESGFAVLAPAPENPVCSVSHKGKVIPVSELTRHLYRLDSENHAQPVKLKEPDWQTILETSKYALQTINEGQSPRDYLKLAGLDYVLEYTTGSDGKPRITPILLEINPRPSGLVYARGIRKDNWDQLTISSGIFQYLLKTSTTPENRNL